MSKYTEQDHIQTSEEGCYFGYHGDYKYRVMDKQGISPIHHTNSLDDAQWYFNKCRKHWESQDAAR